MASRRERVRVAVIGAGAIGAFHARTLVQLPDAELSAVIDKDRRRAERIGKELCAPAFEDAAEGLSASRAQAALVATPETVRREPVRAVLEAGLPLFLEKPLSTSLREGEAIARAIARRGASFQIGFQRRYDTAVCEVKKALLKLGPPELVRSLTHDPTPPTLEGSLRAGGIVFSTIVHDIDTAQFLAGPIESVFARGAKLVRKYDHPEWLDTLLVSVRFRSGALGVLEASWRTAYGYDARVEVHARGGLLQAGGFPWIAFTRHDARGGGSLHPRSFLEQYGEAYRREVAAFVAAVRSGAPCSPTLADALSALRVAAAVKKSLRTGRVVRV